MSAFTPLRVRSQGSLLFGTASPEALMRRALELGCERLALTDRDNLYLAIRFWRAARAEGLRPLVGATIGEGVREALLIPLDRRGYAHLCALITRRMLDPEFDLVQALAPSTAGCPAAGLHVIVESPGLAAALLAAGVPAARGARGPVSAARGDGGLWLGVRGLASERSRLGERTAAARALGIPLVATGDCALLTAADHDAHRTAVTAAAGELLDRMPPVGILRARGVLRRPRGVGAARTGGVRGRRRAGGGGGSADPQPRAGRALPARARPRRSDLPQGAGPARHERSRPPASGLRPRACGGAIARTRAPRSCGSTRSSA